MYINQNSASNIVRIPEKRGLRGVDNGPLSRVTVGNRKFGLQCDSLEAKT
jgi:hypothetical protein